MSETRTGTGVPVPSLVCASLLALLAACGGGDGDGAPAGSDGGDMGRGAAATEGDALFRDVTAETGLAFHHVAGATGRYYFPEIMGAGVGLLDIDGDGDLDVYLPQGGAVQPGDTQEGAVVPPPEAGPYRNRLFRNDLDGGALRFTDVTESSGTGDTGYAMGCTVGDYDNDGDDDLYVTNYGANVLLRNDGGGRFTDVTADAGVGDPLWSVSAAFLDYDGDGDLDLFVVNYVAFADDVLRECTTSAGDREYCSPLAYRPQPDTLYRNDGGGKFTDVSKPAGIRDTPGNGLGISVADFDGDGRIDVYVANDAMANRLWMNQGDGRFVDEGLLNGAAVNSHGAPEAGMGVSVADFDRDGDEDIFVVHLFGETNTLYVNNGKGLFDDRTFPLGLGAASRSMTGFGTQFLDYDNDGWLDLLVVNGAVAKVDTQLGRPWPYKMTNQLFRGGPGGKFQDVTAPGGQALAALESSRGLAIGDLDLDGDLDAVVSNNNGPAQVLLNQVGARNHWLRVALEAPGACVLGALVSIELADGSRRAERVRTDGSYASASDARVSFGLGTQDATLTVSVRWPDGTRETFPATPVDREVVLRRGAGQ